MPDDVLAQVAWGRHVSGLHHLHVIGIDLAIPELEDLQLDISDELIERFEHASAMLNSPRDSVHTYMRDQDRWAADARPKGSRHLLQLHRVAVARAAALARADQEIKMSTIS